MCFSNVHNINLLVLTVKKTYTDENHTSIVNSKGTLNSTNGTALSVVTEIAS